MPHPTLAPGNEQASFESIESVDPEQAARLLADVMGGAYEANVSEDLWRWKHCLNPAGRSLGLAAYSAERDLIALRPFMRWSLRRGTEPLAAARAIDTIVHPEWRRAGLFSALTSESLAMLESERIGVVFNTPNKLSGPGYAKLGWRLLGHPTLWVRPRAPWRWNGELPGRVSSFSTEAVPVAEQTSGSLGAGISVWKSAEYLAWRYADHPTLTYFTVEVEGATGIVREDQRFGRKGAALVDWLIASGQPAAFRRLLRAVLKACPGAYLVTGPLSRRGDHMVALSLGFVPVRWRNVQLAVRPIGAAKADEALTDKQAWNLTLGDLESF